MALTEQDFKNLLIQEMGKTGDACYTGLVDTWWGLFPYATTSYNLQYLLVKRHSIIHQLISSNNYDWTEADVTRKLSQIDARLLKIIPILDKQISNYLNAVIKAKPDMVQTIRMTINDPDLPYSFPYRMNDIVMDRFKCPSF